MRLEAFTIATITKYVNVTLCPICAPSVPRRIAYAHRNSTSYSIAVLL